MKKLFFLLIAANSALSAFAQTPAHDHSDSLLSRWVIDINALGGGVIQNLTTANTTNNYLNAINSNTGNLKFRNGIGFGGDAQLGFFFGRKRHWGIGTGVLYLREMGDATLDNFHVEYQSTDANGYTFRQAVTANQANERLQIDNFNIPLVLKYKNRFSKHWGFAADAGVLFNLMMKNQYTTNAAFDYEAIYKLTNVEGTQTAVYDNAAVPATKDFLITKAQYVKNNPDGNLGQYFATKQAEGYNVGLGVKPNKQTGSVSYQTGSVGFLLQPSFDYFFSDHVALNLGGYILYQPFTNKATNGYMLTSGPNEYSSVMNNVTHTDNIAYGLNVGLRFFLGKKRVPLVITSIDQSSPSYCGLCDGAIMIHGLFPNQPVIINYSMNGAAPATYPTTVDATNTARITGLCAGTYTGITASIGRKKAIGTSTTIVDPPLRISSQVPTNPTAAGTCDGTITMYGLMAGKPVTVNYAMNGAPQSAYSGTVAQDNTVRLTGLCAGSYSSFVVTSGNCTANGTDVTLTAPAPPPPPAPVVEEKIDITTPIMFNFNKTTIHSSSYPVLDEAAKELKEDNGESLKVDGYTDAVGSQSYNMKLSVKRANAVKSFLKKKGVNPKRIKTVGHGKKSPAASNKTAEGRTKNRRAVMHLEPGK